VRGGRDCALRESQGFREQMTETTYRAVVCEEFGPPERLRLKRLPRAPLAPGTVRVAIKAAGVNFPDVLMIQGLYQHRPELPFVPGLEASGVVAEIAADVDGIAVGQKVIAQMRTGGYAEEAVVPASAIRPMPEGFSFEEGATFLVAHMTAYHALKTRGCVAAGQMLLVLGAAGGVGLAAVQIGKLLGARVIAAASMREKLDAAVGQGASDVIDYSTEKVEDGVKRLTSGAGVDVVLDPVGIAQEAALRCLAWNGKLLIAGFAGGGIPSYAANRILLKGCSVIGVRAGEAGRHDPAMRKAELEELLALGAKGLVRPLVSERVPLERFADAMRMLAERRAIGRVALGVGGAC
jgi:NADPH:quinone reductase